MAFVRTLGGDEIRNRLSRAQIRRRGFRGGKRQKECRGLQEDTQGKEDFAREMKLASGPKKVRQTTKRVKRAIFEAEKVLLILPFSCLQGM